MRVLLIYEEVPERTRIWELTLLDEADVDKAMAIHGKMQNVDDMTATEISTIEQLRQIATVNGRLLFDSEIKNMPVQRTHGEFLVIHTGFYL